MNVGEQNPNLGGTGVKSISEILTERSSAHSPDHRPEKPFLPGKQFLPGSPATREAKPSPKISGGDPILT